MTIIDFALNHMTAPARDLAAFCDLAKGLDIGAVEIRNDLAGQAIIDGTPPFLARDIVASRGLRILTINALQRFNDWTEARAAEARELAAYARDCGAAALVLVPVNDTAWQPPHTERLAGLRKALAGLAPILADAGLLGFVEPLGFPECSLRLKREGVDAIDALGLADRFRVVHDTFHHVVAGETEIFPDRVGIVHISGVEDTATPLALVRDSHRVLVGAGDLLGNKAQIAALQAGGYTGPFSFEPFAESVHAEADLAGAVAASMAFVRQT